MGIEKNYRLDWNYFIKEIKKQFCKPRKSVREVGCIQCENPRTPLFNNIGRGHLRPLVKVLMPSHKTKRSPPFHLRTLALIFYLKGAVEERGGERGEGKGSRETLIFTDCVFLSSGFCILTPHPTSTVFAFPNQVYPTWKTHWMLWRRCHRSHIWMAAEQPTLQRCNRFTSTMIFNIKLNIGSC